MASAIRRFGLAHRSPRFRAIQCIANSRRFIETASSATPVSEFDAPLLQELHARGLVQTIAGNPKALSTLLTSPSKKLTSYVGVDPTAPSLHIGHLLPLFNSLHLYLDGHNSIALVGQGTVSIGGDPTGRKTEREEQQEEQQQLAAKKIWNQLEAFYDRGAKYAETKGYDPKNFGSVRVVSNWEWLSPLGLLDFLRIVGRNVRVGQMLARESVKARLDSDKGLNFAEMTYQLLQSYDFYHLYTAKDCTLQIGGSDQFGNITAGIDLISRLNPAPTPGAPETDNKPAPFGLTTPLLLSASGEKLGKSAGNALGLDTPPFEVYQYFLRTDDVTIGTFLRTFTLLPLSQIQEILTKHAEAPHERLAQRTAAEEIVHILFGKDAARSAKLQTRILYPAPEDTGKISAQEILDVLDWPVKTFAREELSTMSLSKLLSVVGDVSRTHARKLIAGGGVTVGMGKGNKVLKPETQISEEWYLDGRLLVLKLGKKVMLAEVTDA